LFILKVPLSEIAIGSSSKLGVSFVAGISAPMLFSSTSTILLRSSRKFLVKTPPSGDA
jgi:hypothetical protein